MIEILSACDLCGSHHVTSSCTLFEPKAHLCDQHVSTRARLTLPSDLCLKESDGTTGVVSLKKLHEGTQFGPFQAPKRKKLNDLPKLPFWVTDSSSEVEFLDTADENACNWMCLVRPGTSVEESNLIAFPGNSHIYFRTRRDVQEGEELLVFYSPYYFMKMGFMLQKHIIQYEGCSRCPVHCPAPTSSVNVKRPCLNQVKTAKRKFMHSRVKKKPGRPAKITDFNTHLPTGSTHETEVRLLPKKSISLPDKEKWNCSQCGAEYDDGLKFAHHFQKHFSSRYIHLNSSSKLKVTERRSTEISHERSKKGERFDLQNENLPSAKMSADASEVCVQECCIEIERMPDELVQNIMSSENVITVSSSGNGPQTVQTDDRVLDVDDEQDCPNVISDCQSVHDEKSSLNGNAVVTPNCDKSESKSASTGPELENKNTPYNLRTKRKRVLLSESEDVEMSCSDEEINFGQDSELDSEREFKDEAVEKSSKDSPDASFHESSASDLDKDTNKTVEKQKSRSKTDCAETICASGSNSILRSEENGEKGENTKDNTTVESKESKTSQHFISDLKKKYLKYNTKAQTSTFQCDICCKTFSSSYYLYRHTKKHTGDYSCFKCKKAFARKEGLINHNCEGNQSYQCSICKKTFCQKKLLEKHLYLHSKPFKCEECENGFATKDALVKHACAKSKRVVHCPVCRKEFSNSYLMLKHLPVHTGQFSCPLCSKWLCSSFAATSHLLICKDVKEIVETGSKQCPTCQKEFFSVKDYRAHEFTHTHSFECKDCNGHFISHLKLQNHQCTDIKVPCPYCSAEFNGIPTLKKHSCPKFGKPYQCMFCKVWFQKIEELQEHECARNDLAPKSTASSRATELLVCDQCGKTFATISSLNAHKVVHGEKKLSCSVCNKKFHRRNQLENHALMHAGPTVPCPHCNKLFKCKRSMNVHTKTHFTEKKFSCPVCFKAFHQKGNLVKHQQTHFADRMYVCMECGKSYKSKDTLMKHHKIHDEGNELSCIYCEKTFLDKGQLKCHINVAHFGQTYTCKYCGVATRMRHSMTRHLMKKHSQLVADWKSPGVLDGMCTIGEQLPNQTEPADTQDIIGPEGEMLMVPASLGENRKLDLVEDLLCVEEVVQSSLEVITDIRDDSDLHVPNGEDGIPMNDDNTRKQVVVSNSIELNDHQIEELRLKFQEEHSDTVVLDDGTVIQQQPAISGSNDIIFYVIPKPTEDT